MKDRLSNLQSYVVLPSAIGKSWIGDGYGVFYVSVSVSKSVEYFLYVILTFDCLKAMNHLFYDVYVSFLIIRNLILNFFGY